MLVTMLSSGGECSRVGSGPSIGWVAMVGSSPVFEPGRWVPKRYSGCVVVVVVVINSLKILKAFFLIHSGAQRNFPPEIPHRSTVSDF